MNLRFGSVCSGIEAASQAWHHLGWESVFFSEIEKFPSAVLAHHYGSNMPGDDYSSNGVPNYGDMIKFKEWPDHGRGSECAIDVLVGGTPCQSFSVAGLRKGIADPRGNLMLTFGAIAQRYKPRWIVWENVPGVLSSNRGRDFGAFLRLLGECGYGFAYRILDAQYVRVDGFERAVPQRRRRVFVVGYFGDWRPAAAVLSEPEGLFGHTPPRRKAGKAAAPTISARTSGGGGLGTDFDLDGGVITDPVSLCLNAGGMGRQDWETESLVAKPLLGKPHSTQQADKESFIFDPQITSATNRSKPRSDVSHTLPGQSVPPKLAAETSVRRLVPVECERLQGFPDNFTKIPWRGKPADQCPFGPRYKALGNSMAVNVMRWIGVRIEMTEALMGELA